MKRTRIPEFFRKFNIEIFQRKKMPRGIALEHDLRRIFNFSENAMIFDIGANVGQTAIGARACFPNAIIHSFEPVKETYAQLVKEVQGLSINCHNLAFSDTDGIAHMQVYDTPGEDGRNSEFNKITNDQETLKPGTHQEQVEVVTLDSFCKRNEIHAIDWLKMDVESHEMSVLSGARGLLESGKIKAVYCEASLILRDKDECSFTKILKYLSELDYIFFAIYDYSDWQTASSEYSFSNAMFVKKGLSIS